jgi:cytochrome c oxidase subunit 3
MPAKTTIQDIEIIVEKVGGGGGGKPPAGGQGGGEGDRPRRPEGGKPSPNRYSTGVALAIVSILMFFMALASAFIILKGSSVTWVPVHFPPILWVNTVILLASSLTLELARRRLSHADLSGFRSLWFATTSLGLLFLVGQIVAWRQLVAQGIYVASNQASSFFYIFTGAHGLHLVGGVGALLYVGFRNFEKAMVTQSTAAEITSYYWHFMDALWIFLLALLYLGK